MYEIKSCDFIYQHIEKHHIPQKYDSFLDLLSMRMKTNRNKIVSFAADFKKEYEEYAKKTPAYMNQELWLFAIFYLVIIVTNICLTTTIYI